jgi:hypothetical protein
MLFSNNDERKFCVWNGSDALRARDEIRASAIQLVAAGVATSKMDHKLDHTVRNAALVTLVSLVALAAGCGDSLSHGKGGTFRSAITEHVKERMGGAQLELHMYTSCEGLGSDDPATRCAGISSAEIEVFFDGTSLLFDFSNVARSGTISDTGFEGYVLSLTGDSRMAAIVDASIDPAVSTVDPSEVGIEVDGENVAVSFQGLEYDDTTFVKVDLVFE